MNGAEVVLLLMGLTVLFSAVFLLVTTVKKRKTIHNTQHTVSDKKLLYLFHDHPGGMLSPHQVAEKTGLRLAEARTRLNYFAAQSILRRGGNATRHYYELYAPLEEPAFPLELSSEPFLTVADLQQIFSAYDHRVSPGDLIVATGLPWKVLYREMVHFKKKGVIEGVRMTRPGDSWKQYILREPYHQPLPAGAARTLDLELRELLENENLLV